MSIVTGENRRSPDEACGIRGNTAFVESTPDFVALHPGYKWQ